MRKRRNILLAITDTHHGFLRGVLRYAREHRWLLVADMVYTAKIPFGWKGDGIVSYVGYRDDLADFVMAARVPAVEISFLRADLPLPKVGGDDRRIGRLAADHFLERGYRHFAWAPFADDALNRDRHRAFAERLAQARPGTTCHLLPPLDTAGDRRNWASRRKELIAALKMLPKPLAVFAYNDGVAADVIHACADGRLPVPESVAVLGVDNDLLFCESTDVPISSILHDLEGMAYRACALLDSLISGKKPPRRPIRIAPRGLIVRRSTDIVAVGHLKAARALRFIGDRHAEPRLGVADVVAATGLSRRPLEKAFRRELGRSIHDEIVRVRLEKARHLLATTPMKVAEVAAATGFDGTNTLHRLFRRLFATTPKAYQIANLVGNRKTLPSVVKS